MSPFIPRPRLDKFSLKTVLIVPFIALTFLAVGLAGYLSFQSGKEAVNDVAYQLRKEITHRIEDHLASFLTTPMQINEINADAIHQGLLNTADPQAMERHFWHQIRAFNTVTSIYMGSVEGGLVNSGREGAGGAQYVIATDNFKKGAFKKYATDSSGNRTELMVTVPDFDARTREWYRYAVGTGSAVWSPAYILFTGQDMAVAASRPVYDTKNRIAGVVSVDIFLSHIGHFLANLTIGKNGHAFIIERSGLLIASSSSEKPFTEPGDTPQRRIHASESTTPIIRHAAESLIRHTGRDYAVVDEQNVEFQLEGQRHFLQVSPLIIGNGLDWLIVVVVPESDFMERIDAINLVTISLIAATLLIIMAIGYLTATRITNPILRLNTSALALAKGEWERELPRQSRFFEINTLIQSFHKMASQLQEMLNDLNQENAVRTQAESALRKSEAHLRTLIETIPDLIWLKNPDGVYLACNPKFERFFGAKEADIVGKTDFDFVDEELATFFQQHDQAAMAANRPTMNEEEVTYADDGHRELLETIKTPMYDSEHNLIGVLGVARDITHRKESEESLRREKEFSEMTLHAQKDAFFLYDPLTGKAIRWNSAFRNITGYTDAEIESMPAPQSYFSQAELEKMEGFLQSDLKAGTGSIELELTRKDGVQIPTEYSVSFIHAEDGAPHYIMLIGRDMRDRKMIEAQLQQTQKMDAIGTLAGGIAHDFNNVLGVITGNITYALSLLNREEELFKVLSEIKKGAAQAQKLTQQLLTFAKGGAPIKKVTDLNPLIHESSQFVTRGSKSKCTYDLSPDLWPADVDEGQISQVIHNLVINSNQAMPDGGIIAIETKNKVIHGDETLSLHEGLYILITVKDQGTGIPKEHIEKIFDPFFTTKQKGSGLGLATSYSIIKKHGGDIAVHSEPGSGTTVRVYLPASSKAMEKKQEKTVVSHTGQGRILIMDDQEPILAMVSRMLNHMGYQTEEATDGAQAIKMYREAFHSHTPFDLVILDLTIPGGVGGIRTIRELLKIDPRVKAIVSSGYSNDPIMSNYHDYGFCGVVPKPYSINEIARLLNTLLGPGA